MNQSQRAGCTLLILLATGAVLTPVSVAAKQPARENRITVTVDASQKGKIIASGTFTTADKVTLRKVTVHAYPFLGGAVPPPATLTVAGIDRVKNTWGQVTLDTDIYKGGYAIRVDGVFSNESVVASPYVTANPDGNPAPVPDLVLDWAGGFPTGTPDKRIRAAGTYTGKLNADKTGTVLVIPLAGGTHRLSNLKFDKPKKDGWIADPEIPTTPGAYTVIVLANDDKRRPYCAPYSVTSLLR